MLNNLKIFILHDPSKNLTLKHDSLANKLFSKIISMRTQGYNTRHTGQYLPLDATDFIADHIIVCEMRDNEPIPLMSYKSVTLQKCISNNIQFPFLSILYDSGNKNCLLKTEEIIQKCLNENILISYDSGWTMSPEVNDNKDYRKLLKDLTVLTCSEYHKLKNIPYWLTFGICKVKTDLFFERMGSDAISDTPLINHSKLLNTIAKAFIHKEHAYPSELLNEVSLYESLWNTRVELNEDEQSEDTFKIAA